MEVCSSQGTPLWKELRASIRYPTGSKVPCCLHRGYHSRRKEWFYVTGREKEEFSDRQLEIMGEGTMKESEGRWHLQDVLGRPCYLTGSWQRNNFFSSPDALLLNDDYKFNYDWDGFTQQTLLRAEEGAVTPVEIKCPTSAEVLDKLPGHERLSMYFIQLETHEYVTKADDGFLYIYSQDRGCLLYHRHRDPYLWDFLIVPAVEEFMMYVEKDIIPPNKSKKDPLVQRMEAWEEDLARQYQRTKAQRLTQKDIDKFFSSSTDKRQCR